MIIPQHDFVASKMWSGESICSGVLKSGVACTKKAYYECESNYYCGSHGDKSSRTKLRKNPNASKNRENEIELHFESVEVARLLNVAMNRRGEIAVIKRGRFGTPLLQGFARIYPNCKDVNKKDGTGMPSLSPMNCGPVKTCEGEGYDVALNVENYHQYAKCFEDEIDERGVPRMSFFKTMKLGYEDENAHRHKLKSNGENRKGEIPVGSFRRSGELIFKYSYIESRWFYCNAYVNIVRTDPDLRSLLHKSREGLNIEICGPDGPSTALLSSTDNLSTVVRELYYDPSHPFGHEMVLFTMLSLLRSEWPWNTDKPEGILCV